MHIKIRPCAAPAVLAVLMPTCLHAAGGAFLVDDAAIGKPGECQVEAWSAHASNGHFTGVAQPACVASLGIPIEFTATFSVARTETWTTFAGMQAKVTPWDAGRIAVALSAGTLIDATSGDTTLSYVNVPLTLKMAEDFRINLNVGGQWSEHEHLSWGGGFEWDLRPSWTLLAELSGLTGPAEDPRLQIGLRHSPTQSIDLDLIYGNNIAGEHAHWITAGTTARF
jgi:hypothetical protein